MLIIMVCKIYIYPLVMTDSLHMAIEIVCFPIKDGGSFHSDVNVYQRVPTVFLAYQYIPIDI